MQALSAMATQYSLMMLIKNAKHYPSCLSIRLGKKLSLLPVKLKKFVFLKSFRLTSMERERKKIVLNKNSKRQQEECQQITSGLAKLGV
jgi:hypothetical protein